MTLLGSFILTGKLAFCERISLIKMFSRWDLFWFLMFRLLWSVEFTEILVINIGHTRGQHLFSPIHDSIQTIKETIRKSKK